MKVTTIFHIKEVFFLLISFQIQNTNIKKKAINKGNKQLMNVLRIKIEFENSSELKSAKKQSNDMIESVVYPKTYPAEKVDVIAFG